MVKRQTSLYIILTLLFVLSITLLFHNTPQTLALDTTITEDIVPFKKLREVLTCYKWEHSQEVKLNTPPELITWEFYKDKTFRWQFISDYRESYQGAWSFAASGDHKGIIFLASSAQDTSHSPHFDVLSVEFENGLLKLGEIVFRKTVSTSLRAPFHIQNGDEKAVTIQWREQYFSLWSDITRMDWQIKSNADPGEPDSYTFKKDGTYCAYFADKKCRYTGTWSLFSAGKDTGIIRWSIPVHSCDPRGPRDAFILEMPITLNKANSTTQNYAELIIYKTIYASVPRN